MVTAFPNDLRRGCRRHRATQLVRLVLPIHPDWLGPNPIVSFIGNQGTRSFDASIHAEKPTRVAQVLVNGMGRNGELPCNLFCLKLIEEPQDLPLARIKLPNALWIDHRSQASTAKFSTPSAPGILTLTFRPSSGHNNVVDHNDRPMSEPLPQAGSCHAKATLGLEQRAMPTTSDEPPVLCHVAVEFLG